MNLKTLSKPFRWRFARLAIALIGTVALLLICLTSCKSQQTASESHYLRQQTLTRSSDAACHVSTTTHDTIAILHTETLWREPDSLGKIYPLLTMTKEQSAKRTALKQTKVTKVDTLYITEDTDHIATATAKSSAGCSPPREGHPFLRWLPWVLLAGVVVIFSRRIQ